MILSSLGPLEDHTPNHPSSKRQTTHNRNSHQALPRHLVIDELPQTSRLHVRRFLVQEQVVVAPGLAVVAELEVSESKVVETFSATFGGGAEDFREETDAFLLVVASVGFD